MSQQKEIKRWGFNAISPDHDCGGPTDCLWCMADLAFIRSRKVKNLFRKNWEVSLVSWIPFKETGCIRVQFMPCGDGDDRKCVLLKLVPEKSQQAI